MLEMNPSRLSLLEIQRNLIIYISGGNIATGMVLKAIENRVRLPSSLILVYPCLSFEMACWMTPEMLGLVGDTRIGRSKTELDVRDPLYTSDAPRRIDMDKEEVEIDEEEGWYHKFRGRTHHTIHSGLSMTSRMSFFSDRIIHPESKAISDM